MGGMTPGGGNSGAGLALRAYPAYCDSGVEWLREIPVGWGVVPAKALFGRVKELNDSMQCMNRLSLTMKGVVQRPIDDHHGLQPLSFDTYQIFEKDDLVFRLIDLQNENPNSNRVGLVPEKGIMSPAYTRLSVRNQSICPEYYYWFFVHLGSRRVFNALGGGVRQSLGADDLLRLEVALPPIAEQRGIVGCLDRETERIDGLIGKKERLIGLLRERRGALISQVVTKGLDSGARMKDSGVEWLGEIPAGWKVVRNKEIFVEVDDRSETGEETLLAVSEYYGVKPRAEVIAEGEFLSRAESLVGYKRLRTDDLAMNFMLAWKSGLGFSRCDGIISPAYAVFRLKSPEANPKYLHYLLRSPHAAAEFKRWSYGIIDSRLRLYPDVFLSLRCLLPPLAEQREIAAYLDRETGKIDALIGKVEGAIALLREYRAALISAAVTGKIDVRKREAA